MTASVSIDMKVHDAYNQFDELAMATQVFLDEESLGEFEIATLKDSYIKCIEPVLADEKKFKWFIEYIEMTPADFFLLVITATGCEIKDITKKMSKELKQTLKEGKIR